MGFEAKSKVKDLNFKAKDVLDASTPDDDYLINKTEKRKLQK